VGAAAAVALGFVPVLTGLAADNRGLQQAGVNAASSSGTLVTDSPVAAYWSHKAPNEVLGSRALPLDNSQVLPWLRANGVQSLVLENVDYYRAHQALPQLVSGNPDVPYVFLGDQAAYNVPGGKQVYAYTIGQPVQPLTGGAALTLGQSNSPRDGKTSGLAKGPLLTKGGRDLTGDGLGFGVPFVQSADGWWFGGRDSPVSVSPDGKTWTRVFNLDQHEIDDANGHFLRFEAGPSEGRIQVTYRPSASGTVGIQVRPLELKSNVNQVVIANEESASFDDYADAVGPRSAGNWLPVRGDWARFRSGKLGVEWEVPAPPPPASFFSARELNPPGIDFSGLEWSFNGRFSGVDYTVSIRSAR
jgi:hypothetical protein